MTALRELAERWKSYDGHITGKRDALSVCADELLHVLDAEGDGGAVGGMSLFTGTIGGVHVGLHGTKESVEALDAFLESAHPHPARSGGVSDEDVRDALVAACGDGDYPSDPEVERDLLDGMRAALEHFAKRSDEDARDAERYRYIRDNNWSADLYPVIIFHKNARWDAAIDAAIQGERHER